MVFSVEEVTQEAQQIVSITSNVYVHGLDQRIRGNLMTLRSFVLEQDGEITGPPLGIYYGHIGEESDGPIEVCLPAKGKFVPVGEVIVRELSGGKSVRVVARGEHCVYPAILGAYDAAVDWIHKNGHEMEGPPREGWVSVPGEELEMHIVWSYR